MIQDAGIDEMDTYDRGNQSSNRKSEDTKRKKKKGTKFKGVNILDQGDIENSFED